MSLSTPVNPTRLILLAPRFAKAREDLKQEYRSFLQEQVLIDPINTQAFFFIDQLRRNEPARKGRRLALHDQLSLFLIKGDLKPVFKGLETFVKELRPLLVAAGKIPRFVPWIPFVGKPYRLAEKHKTWSSEEANDRLDSLRAVIGEMARTQGTKQS